MCKLQLSARKATCGSIVIISLCVCAFSQAARLKGGASGREVKVQHDRFTGERTISFEPQLILDHRDHRMSLEAEAKPGGNRPRRDIPELDDRVTFTFSSMSKAGVEFGDRELHFLVDGERIRIGRAAPRMPTSSGNPTLPVGQHLLIVLPLNKLQQIARGRDVQLRLGPIELTLDNQVMSVLKEFVAACGHTKP